MKKFSLLLVALVTALALTPGAKGASPSGDTEGPIKSQAKLLDYADIYSKVWQMQELMDLTITAASVRGDSPLPTLTNDAIASWFNVDPNFQHKEVTDGESTISRDENECLLIKRDLGYLRVIDKAALVEDREIGLMGDRNLTLTEYEALASAENFAEYLGIPGGDVSRVDIKKVVGEAGGDAGVVLQRIEAEYLVTFYRKHNGIPVANSLLRFTVDDSGKIKRLLARWPEMEPRSEKRSAIETSKVAEAIYEQLDSIYYKNPMVRFSLMPMIHHEVSRGKIYAEPVIRVMAIGTSSEVSEPIVVFHVKMTE